MSNPLEDRQGASTFLRKDMRAANDNFARTSALPYGVPPRGMSRSEAAAYIGVGTTLFDELVADGKVPRPKKIKSRSVWDRLRLDEAFDNIDEAAAPNAWDLEYCGRHG